MADRSPIRLCRAVSRAPAPTNSAAGLDIAPVSTPARQRPSSDTDSPASPSSPTRDSSRVTRSVDTGESGGTAGTSTDDSAGETGGPATMAVRSRRAASVSVPSAVTHAFSSPHDSSAASHPARSAADSESAKSTSR